MAWSEGTKQALRGMIELWLEASSHERDPAEHRAFETPAAALERMMERPEATHEDIRKVIPICPGYPASGRSFLLSLANAERDGRKVEVTREGRSFNTKIEPPAKGGGSTD